MAGAAGSVLTAFTATLVLLAWQVVSDFMPGLAGSLLTVLTPTLVLLTWQEVSDFVMPGPAESLLTVLTLTLVLVAWQWVSDFMPGPMGPFPLSSLPPWSCLLDRKWVISSQVQLGPFSLFSHSDPAGLTVCEWFHARSCWAISHCPHPHSGAVGWQLVSDFSQV